ncbi:hypothetical protein [Actinomadura sp. WMMB 499]|uniref:hypothetical protein n=1 Tax=Actinomadura sp. WMMB 499 TaxID=1219491 RepID=UPI001C3F943B|nr:hypothetical protein [Actinomadura sp. WMMB 499]
MVDGAVEAVERDLAVVLVGESSPRSRSGTSSAVPYACFIEAQGTVSSSSSMRASCRSAPT